VCVCVQRERDDRSILEIIYVRHVTGGRDK